MVLLYVDLRGLAADRRHRARHRPVPRAAARSRSRSCRRSSRRSLFALAGAMALLPGDIERRLGRWAVGLRAALAHWVARARDRAGARGERRAHRDRARCARATPACSARSPGGALTSRVLWAMFHAFGSPPPFTVIWMAYFVGMLGNLLPLPGGLGGVEGGDDRRVRRVRRRLQPVGARRALLPRDLLLAADAARARSPTSSCAAPSPAGATSSAAPSPRRRAGSLSRRARAAGALAGPCTGRPRAGAARLRAGPRAAAARYIVSDQWTAVQSEVPPDGSESTPGDRNWR